MMLRTAIATKLETAIVQGSETCRLVRDGQIRTFQRESTVSHLDGVPAGAVGASRLCAVVGMAASACITHGQKT